MKGPTKLGADGTRNTHVFREPWLMDAVAELRDYFQKSALTIPDKLRCGFSITSSGKKAARKGECWPPTASADGHFEIFISPDIAEPVAVLVILVRELVHACLPESAGHGPKYKEAANRIGLIGAMRKPEAGPLLLEFLARIAETLGPLPHASLDLMAPVLDRPAKPIGAPKKQKARMLKAECHGKLGQLCGYTARVAAKWVDDLGPPHCPKHGAMAVKRPAGEDDDYRAETVLEGV
jgi:hypothetical protein